MCLNPLRASLPPDGGRPQLDTEGDLKIPCGKCIECISKRAIDWSSRASHEISLHKKNCFITLTYDEENLPSHLVVKDYWQKFFKRLRYHTSEKLLYMVSHEYGTQNFRPHHHAIIFGHSFDDMYFWKKTKSGYPIFRSETLEKLWPYGFSSIADANEKTAYYIASYALSGKERELLAPNGEIIKINDCMDVSKRPGIGLNYFIKNASQLVHSKTPLPRYYLKKLTDEKFLDKHPELVQLFDKLIEVYENNILEALSCSKRSDHQVYAKQVIANQKKSMTENEYRVTPTNEVDKYLLRNLKSTRDNFQSRKKEKEK